MALIFSDEKLNVLPLLLIALLFVIFGHIHISNPGGHALFIPFNATSWIVIYFLIGVGVWVTGIRGKLFYSVLSKQLFWACLFLSIPLLYQNAEVGQVFPRILGLWSGYAIFLTLQQFQIDRHQIIMVLMVVLLAVWIETIRYWWTATSHYYAYAEFPTEYQYGMYGVFQQRNVFASFIACGLVISSFLLTQARGSRFELTIKIMAMLAPIFMLQILISAASRAGWFGALFGCALVLPLLYRNTSNQIFLLWIAAWAIGFGIAEMVVTLGDFVVPEKNILSLSGGRTYLFPQVIAMFLEKPLFGFGYGNFEFSYMHNAAEQFSLGLTDFPPIAETFHPHNEILLWGVEGGIVPLIGLGIAIYGVWRVVFKQELGLSLAIIGLFFPIVLHTQVEFPFYASVMHWVIFVILIFYADSISSEKQSLPLKGGRVLQFTGIVLPVVATWFLVTTIQAGIIYSRYMEMRAPLTSLTQVQNAVVWRNHLNWAINSAAVLVGRDNDRPELIQQYIDWAPGMIAEQPRPIFYEYLILAHLSLNETDEADALIEEFRFLFPDREFSVITVE